MIKKTLLIAGACAFSLLVEAQLSYIGNIDKGAYSGNYGETESPKPVAYYNNPSDVVLAYTKAADKSVTFYKSDLSVAKKFLCSYGFIPNFIGFGYIEDAVNGNFYVSQQLFNDDDKFEFIVWIMTNNRYRFCIYNDDLQCLFTSSELFYTIQKITLHATSAGYLLCLGDDRAIPDYYALPGYQVEGTEIRSIRLLTLNHPYPNPATDYIDLPYTLPENTTTGVIRIYNMQGQLIQTSVVDGAFDYIRVSTSTLPAGNYIYNLDVNGQLSEGQQFVIMR
jgi:hypothetical protein